MPTSNYVGTLKINELTTAQYNTAVQSDIISDDDLSFLTDALDEQQTTMPTAEAKYEGQIVQFVGTTDASYTNGYFYKCVSDGGNPATYSWTRVDVQPAGTSYTAGTGIDITGGVVSVANPTLTNKATGNASIAIGTSATVSVPYAVVIGGLAPSVGGIGGGGVAIGRSAATYNGGIAIGETANTNNTVGIAIGQQAKTSAANAIQIGVPSQTNSDANTFKVGNANGNFEIMSADGSIPTGRFTTSPVSDGAYIPTVTVNSGIETRSWETPTTVTFRTWGANE